ncbi:hypothetical protein COCSUDRAFT_48394 [Coccomyxa subellipsoidea C-169]|uniref:Uncharacterized protein n=1 Tax=Coccomyxa subellipsoidea (strain C-169) TaxID=574566 RepID=I0YQT5_COCSC|nr:hypothetical protein COCSUDRAFT_48394 [Coccomyxa subellipsoidea C-169]EIE20754.1 hypothetical protein COCSUDRAFT_48394 [Coccomyxa subellipsoidea C-169]|eukprot:XP_005645298.1 hypothetical protein COCSUDRAFT_48394 [Coccomyxa subellipsoidea C-169]
MERFGLEALPTEEKDTDEDSIDWRALYEWRLQEYEDHTRTLGQRLKRLGEECLEDKNRRTLQVIQHAPRRQAPRGAGNRLAPPPPRSRHRLLKKLGMRAAPSKKAPMIRPARRPVRPAPAPEPPAKWASTETHRGLLLVECDLGLPGDPPTTKVAPAADSAMTSPPLPAPTDNRFTHMPRFEEPRKACAQAGKQGVLKEKGQQGKSSMKRPPQPLTPEGPAKRRKPELLSASALAAIAASGRRGAAAGKLPAGAGNRQQLPAAKPVKAGQPARTAIRPGGSLSEKGARQLGQGSEFVRSKGSGGSKVQPAKQQGFATLIETDIF